MIRPGPGCELSPAYVNRGAAYNRKGSYDRAIVDFTQALTLNPNLAPAYYNRGTSYQMQGDPGRAVTDFSQTLTLNPRYVAAYVDRETCTDQGNYESAIADCTQALTLNPNYFLAYHHRAVAQFSQKDYTKAWADVKRFQQACGTPNPQFLRDLRKASGRQR